jgi:ankyrin repeat protein
MDKREKLFESITSEPLGTIENMLNHGIDLNGRDRGGKTPLQVAVLTDRPDVVRFFIEQGADVNAQDDHGDTALAQAAAMGNLLKHVREIITLLMHAGADVSIKNSLGYTALEIARTESGSELAKYIKELENQQKEVGQA